MAWFEFKCLTTDKILQLCIRNINLPSTRASSFTYYFYVIFLLFYRGPIVQMLYVSLLRSPTHCVSTPRPLQNPENLCTMISCPLGTVNVEGIGLGSQKVHAFSTSPHFLHIRTALCLSTVCRCKINKRPVCTYENLAQVLSFHAKDVCLCRPRGSCCKYPLSILLRG